MRLCLTLTAVLFSTLAFAQNPEKQDEKQDVEVCGLERLTACGSHADLQNKVNEKVTPLDEQWGVTRGKGKVFNFACRVLVENQMKSEDAAYFPTLDIISTQEALGDFGSELGKLKDAFYAYAQARKNLREGAEAKADVSCLTELDRQLFAYNQVMSYVEKIGPNTVKECTGAINYYSEHLPQNGKNGQDSELTE